MLNRRKTDRAETHIAAGSRLIDPDAAEHPPRTPRNADMTRIECGPTTERRVRTALFFMMFAVFAAYFLYDGWIGYPAENFREHLEDLPVELREDAANARIYASVAEDAGERAQTALTKFDAKAQRQALEDTFGGPPSYESAEAIYYFGPVHRVKIGFTKNGKLKSLPVANYAKKTATSIAWQKGLGVGLAVFSLIILLHLIRVFRARLVLDEEGLRLTGKAPIAWEDIRSLESDEFEKKGWVDLVCERGSSKRTVRLDEYHVTDFPAAMAEICSRKGFEDPVAKEKARKQAESPGT